MSSVSLVSGSTTNTHKGRAIKTQIDHKTTAMRQCRCFMVIMCTNVGEAEQSWISDQSQWHAVFVHKLIWTSCSNISPDSGPYQMVRPNCLDWKKLNMVCVLPYLLDSLHLSHLVICKKRFIWKNNTILQTARPDKVGANSTHNLKESEDFINKTTKVWLRKLRLQSGLNRLFLHL